jgi:Ca-activated chloride channel family protein
VSFDFEQPFVLLLLPLGLGVVYALWRTSRAYMPPVRRRVSLALRLAVVTVLTLVLASPLVQLRANELAVAVLMDRSDSISPAARAQEEQWLDRALAAKSPQDRVAVVTFAGDASLERPLSADPQAPRLSTDANLHSSRTDIAAAIRTGLAALPPDSARRLVLLTDGGENLEKADSAAGLAAAAGVQLDTVPLNQSTGPEALVQGLDAPTQLREGDRFSVTARVQSTVPQSATLHLLLDDRLVASQDVQLDQGTSRFVLPLEPLPQGHHVLRLQLEADSDTLPQNNTAGAYVVVSGAPRILVVEGTPGEGQYLADALRASGLQVDVAQSRTAPLAPDQLRGYASLVLVDVPASDLVASELDSIKTYVQDYGGGLVVAGGDHAFGPGGYARTPLEDMLPVRMDLRGRSVSASTALVLVIDNSGSMGENVGGGTTKMELAKQAAVAAAELLGEYDQIGVIAFEDTPRWVIQPTPASDLSTIESAISVMEPGGGTEIYSAVKAAYDGLLPLDAKVKHIILLTDGEAPRGPYEDLAQQMQANHISLSTIGIGQDADTALLQELAQLGNGRYYDGNDAFDLPQLVVKETQQVQRAAIVEQDTQLIRVNSDPALDGIDINGLPMLRGYVATTPKPQSSVLLASRQIDPVLTSWQFGLGRVMAWTSDATNRWSSRWLQWSDFSRFWTQVVKRTTRPPEDPNRQVSVAIEGNQARITLDAQTGTDATERQYLNFLPTSAQVVDPRAVEHQVNLPQIAPGRYTGTMPVEDDGVYTVQVVQTNADGSFANQSSGFVVPYSPEYRAPGVDSHFLDVLAGRTGGRTVHDPEEALTHDLPAVGAPRALWPWLLVLGALLFVADVGVRRIRVSASEMRSAYRAVRHRLGYTDELPSRERAPMPVPAVPTLVGGTTASGPRVRPTSGVMPQVSASGATHSSRLLAAKQRAARR